jgi:uncharacterized membrane protein
MITTVWPYLAAMLLAAGIFPTLEKHYRWRCFDVLPPIVLTYLLVTLLSVLGLWQVSPEIAGAQKAATSRLVPALVFLLMINCDLRAIWSLGPRVLAVFFCTSITLFVAFISTYALFRHWLPGDHWQPLAALSGSWVGGSANMVAVKQAIGMSDDYLAYSLLTDALCYSLWVVVLFSLARLAPAFNRWTGARSSADLAVAERPAAGVPGADSVLVWLGASLLVSAGCAEAAANLPIGSMIGATTWAILLATGAGLLLAHTPAARYPGASQISGALLAVVVALLASQSNFEGIASAPVYLACGLSILLIHALLLAGFAKLFRFDLYLCGISSLAHIGGVAATPVLAASYSRALVPVGVLLALLGYVLGTGFGILMASVLSFLASH